MKTIHKLTPSQIAKIAAGEVIEKPAFAVKELIENSLDAQSKHIQIFIEEGGLKKILIIDDGVGMSEEDLKECFKLHTTSKVTQDDSLNAIRSMGFRGEALASLASISRMSLQSRTNKAPSGTKITLAEGKLLSSSPIGMPYGTQIEIRDLFYSVPGRKKFMENPQKEYRTILDWVIRIALANPTIRFTLTHNKKLVFDLPGDQEVMDRLKYFLKEDFKLLPINFEDTYVNISGFTSSASISTSSSSKQFIFVNNRPITDKLVSTAIKEAYGTTIEHNKYPIYFIHISVPPEMVDVNVHPRKEQVNLLNRQLIFDQVQKAIFQTLQISHPLSEISKPPSITKSFAGEILRGQDELFMLEKKFVNLDKILQIHDLFLLIQAQNGLIIVDQHAAHERILYEQFKKDFENKKNKKFKLLHPLKPEFSILENQILLENKGFLENLGFSVNFKTGTSITHIPELLKDRNITEILTEFIEQIIQEKSISIDLKSDQLLKYLACRSAIKSGDRIDTKQAKSLVEKLFQTPNHTHCPHGRPTFILQPLKELNKQFKRF